MGVSAMVDPERGRTTEFPLDRTLQTKRNRLKHANRILEEALNEDPFSPLRIREIVRALSELAEAL